ncbi:MAG: NYN domain-containing protein, partial [Acidimicrobiales bacterium]
MPTLHVVVDGSNIATEGRSLPSLAQLDEAVQAFQQDYSDSQITVVVDATFGHRIDESEREMLEEAEAHGEVVSPPAGAIGRGDAFLLLIAERTGATVFSNDSFQEFHGEHEWLFDKGRLIGGKPVPGVGWIFTPRTPVRGPKSREAVKDARRNRVRIGSPEASRPMPVPKAPPPGWAPPGEGLDGTADGKMDGKVAKARPVASGLAKTRVDPKVRKAIEAATKEAETPDSTSAQRRRRRRGAGPPPQAVNEPLAFITFIAEHHLGSEVEGEVEGFTSHGAFVAVDGATGYVPLSGLGDPPPTKARSVLSKGERRMFVLQALDAQRRGLELALPEFASVTGSPSEETVEAEISREVVTPEPAKRTRNRAGSAKASVPTPDLPAPAGDPQAPEPGAAPAAPKPARRTRRPAASAAADEPAASAPAEPELPAPAEPPASTEPSAAPKPVRRRTRPPAASAPA